MATGNPTLLDHAKTMDPDGKVAKLVELLSKRNPFLQDMMWKEGNLTTGHRTTMRTGLPEATWRLLNKGVQPSKATTAQVDDTCGMLEAYAEVDKRVADLNGNSNEFRLSQDKGQIQGMNNEMAEKIIYGNTNVNPEEILGIATRYNYTQSVENEDEIGFNVLDGGGTGVDNTSMFGIRWNDEATFGIFPKGSKAGLDMENLGQVTLEDANGGLYEGYRSHYSWDSGLTVRDWRQNCRIANIDVSDLTTDASTGANLIELAIKAFYRMPEDPEGSMIWYVNRHVAEYLHHQAMNKSNVNLTLDKDFDGKTITRLVGSIVRRADAIVATESEVPTI